MVITDKGQEMKTKSRFLRIVAFAAAAVLAAHGGLAAAGGDPLSAGFREPPRASAPFTWWHWMNGNVTKAGITADLEAMAKVGLGGAQVFDVSVGIPEGEVRFGSDAWFDMLVHAHREAKRLGLQLCVVNGSGFSNSGGPWVTPADSMKALTATEVPVTGPSRFAAALPLPPEVTHGGLSRGFYRDVAVLAVRAPAGEKRAVKGRPCTAGEVRFTIRGPLTKGWRTTVAVTVEAVDGAERRTLLSIPDYPLRVGLNAECLPRTLRFPTTTSREFRLKVDFRGKEREGFEVTDVAFGRFPRLDGRTLTVQAGIAARRSIYAGDVHEREIRTDATAIDRAQTVDLTARVGADGRLDWEVPAGDWSIVRIGYASLGKCNYPATPGGFGLEVDKLDPAAVERHFNAYLGRVVKACGIEPGSDPTDRTGLNAALVDSYEVGGQTWTAGFERYFAKCAGYDIRPWLPAFAGFAVESVAATTKFFADFREAVSERFAEAYPDTLARCCHAAGLAFASECYGHPATDDFRWAWNVDLPMDEFWAYFKGAGESAMQSWLTGFTGIYPRASVAHFRGLRYFGAEAFTCFAPHGRWRQNPWSYKARGDEMYALGINRMVYHRYAHQPWTDPPRYPGMTMGSVGTHFERTQTWWEFAWPWIRYQARSQFLLQEGRFAPDYLICAGEGAPNFGMNEFTPPAGFLSDSCSLALLKRFEVRDGRIVAPSGLSYRVLVVPPGSCRSDAAREEFRRLAAAGVTVIFEAPSADPLRLAGLVPAFLCGEPVSWTHRVYGDGTEGFFLARADETAKEVECSFSATGRVPEIWNAEDGSIVRAARWREEGGRTVVTVPFAARGACFVMFRPPELCAAETLDARRAVPCAEFAGPWRVSFPTNWYSGGAAVRTETMPRLRDWTSFADPDLRYFSGTATYEAELAVPAAARADGARLELDLGDVQNFAEVSVNGRTFAPLWRPPFRVDVTEALGRGVSVAKVRVRVANLWPNRLIGDDRLPGGPAWKPSGGLAEMPEFVRKGLPDLDGHRTFTTWRHWKKDEAPLPSGLLGPVRLLLRK